MSTGIRRKAMNETDVLTETETRIHHIYDSFDRVEVSFSGGKDSTAVLNVALKVARERGKLPLVVNFFDEEAIHPPTIEYVERVRQNPDIDLRWYCLEFKHRNACSNDEPFWFTWDRDKEHLWTRPMPDNVITEHPAFVKGMSFQEFAPLMVDPAHGTTVQLTGLRAQESIRRHRTVARKKNDNYITRNGAFSLAHPIYDWSSEDVWKLVEVWDLDYNRTYDIFNKTAQYNQLLRQRVCPPYGEEPLRGLWIYAECFPDMWHKMIARVPGAATAARYGNTELYGTGARASKPDDITWSDYLRIIIDGYHGEEREELEGHIQALQRMHERRTYQPMPEEGFHPVSGLSWQFLCKVAKKGDFKARTAGNVSNNAQAAQQKLGITEQQAVMRYGTDKYKADYLKRKNK